MGVKVPWCMCTPQSIGAEVRNNLFFWEFAMICAENERDYWSWMWWLFPAGWLADLGLLACSFYDDSVSLCWLTTRQAHWLHANLQGWLPVWLLPYLLNMKRQGTTEASRVDANVRFIGLFRSAAALHAHTLPGIPSPTRSPAPDKASLIRQNLCRCLTALNTWATVHLQGILFWW